MEETVFDKKLHNDFKTTFGNHLLKVSTNYVDSLKILDNHLNAIYGKEISRSRIFEDYLNDSKGVSYIEDIEEVSECYIYELIKTEDEHRLKVDRLQEINSILSNPEIELDNTVFSLILEAVDIIGLNGSEKGLLRDIIGKPSGFVEQPHQFRNLLSALVMIINEVSKLYLSGMQLSFPNTNSVAMTQMKGRCFYRGENAYYKSSKAGCFRGKHWSELDGPGWDYVLWRLRLYQCFDFFDKFDVVKNWGVSEVNYMALAQHYGLRTSLIDMTTNFKTALFFACCKADRNGLDWHPLTKSDFKNYNSRRSVAALGGDSRYAVLYYVPTNIVDCQWVTAKEEDTRNIITPIGYQPFMRCSTQYGYMMNTDENYDLMQDKLFRKVKFRLTENFCNWIYEEMDCGKAIFPNDDDIARIKDIVRVVSDLNKGVEFSRYNAENVRKDITSVLTKEPDKELDPIYFYSSLKRRGIKIREEVKLLSDKNIEKINERYTLDKVEAKMEMAKCSPIMVIGRKPT